MCADPKVMTCNPHNCHPFEEVRAAAKAFVDNLYFPYDRVAVVTLDQQITLAQNLTTDHDVAIAALDALTVMPEPGDPPCNYAPGQDWVNGVWSPIGVLDPSGCTTTNLGGGLRGAGSALTDPTFMRSDSLWVVVLITDGAANHALALPGYPNGYCPATYLAAG